MRAVRLVEGQGEGLRDRCGEALPVEVTLTEVVTEEETVALGEALWLRLTEVLVLGERVARGLAEAVMESLEEALTLVDPEDDDDPETGQ